jgi:precorrin-3B synthase
MLTGDGYLSRVAFIESLTPQSIMQLCEAARRHGIGLLDITARGSLQFRGLSTASACLLESDVSALSLPLREGLAVEASPLGGLDMSQIADPKPIASRIRQQASALNLVDRLAPKMSVVVDGGGQLRMDGLLADIRLKAAQHQGNTVWHLFLGGTEDGALHAGFVAPEDADHVVIQILSWLADKRSSVRGRDLDLSTIAQICGQHLSQGAIDTSAPASTSPYGLIPLGHGRFAASIAPAFGQVRASALIALCHEAGAFGIASVSFAPSHSLLFFGSQAACEALLRQAQVSGFIIAAADPRSSIAVCPGAPACGSALLPAHELADFAAKECADVLDGSFTLHISGCAKGCAHPTPSLIGLSGRPEGLALSVSARVSSDEATIIARADQFAALSRLARLYQNEHKPGENARACLARLGSARIGAALQQDRP